MSDEERNDPIVWLLIYARGKEEGNAELVDRAEKELDRLNIKILWARDRPKKKAKASA